MKTEEPNAQSKKPDLPAPDLGTLPFLVQLPPRTFLAASVSTEVLSTELSPHSAQGFGVPFVPAANGAVRDYLEANAEAKPIQPDPEHAAFQRLISEPGLAVKMIRIETNFTTSSTTSLSEMIPAANAAQDSSASAIPGQMAMEFKQPVSPSNPSPAQTPPAIPLQPLSNPDPEAVQARQPFGPVKFDEQAPAALGREVQAPGQVGSIASSKVPLPKPPADATAIGQLIEDQPQTAFASAEQTSAPLLSKKLRTDSKGLTVEAHVLTHPSDRLADSEIPIDADATWDAETMPLLTEDPADFVETLAGEKSSEPKAQIAQPTMELKTGEVRATEKADSPTQIRERVIGQVADRIEMLAATRRDSVTVVLNPADLGEIKVVIDQAQGHVDAKVYAQDERVRQMLQASHPQLGQALEHRGIKLELFTVGTMSPSGQDLANARHNHTDLPQHAHAPRARFEPEPVKPQVLTSAARGVDYTI